MAVVTVIYRCYALHGTSSLSGRQENNKETAVPVGYRAMFCDRIGQLCTLSAEIAQQQSA